MKHAFNALAVLLLTTGVARFAAADTDAQPLSVHAPGLREQMRALRFEQQAMLQREHQPEPEQQQAHDGNADSVSPQAQTPASGPDDVSRNVRMSPEERRALRQQINEAGHEIYTPSH